MIVNGSVLKVISDVFSKVDSYLVNYSDGTFVSDSKNGIVVIKTDFVENASFSVHKKLITDVFGLLGKDSIDYQVNLENGEIQLKGNGREVSMAIEDVDGFSIDSVMGKEMRELDVDINSIVEVGGFTDNKLNDQFGYVYLLDDGVYGGSESFFTKITGKHGVAEAIGVDPKIVEILKGGKVVNAGVAEDGSFLYINGDVGGVNVWLLCRVAMLEGDRQQAFKSIFTRPEVFASAEFDGNSLKEVVAKMLDPTRDEVVLYSVGNVIKFKFIKSVVKWDDDFGRLVSGEWKEVRLLGRDFNKMVEKIGVIENCGNRIYLKSIDEYEFDAVCATLG